MFRQDYEASIIDEIPSSAPVRYFPEAPARQFGLVRFSLLDSSFWVAGFAEGALTTHGHTGIFASPRFSKRACVLARGRAYRVDVEHPDDTHVIVDDMITQVVPVPEEELLLFVDPWKIRAFAGDEIKWCTDRLAIDGLTVLSVAAKRILVRADDGMQTVDVRDGRILE